MNEREVNESGGGKGRVDLRERERKRERKLEREKVERDGFFLINFALFFFQACVFFLSLFCASSAFFSTTASWSK